ncbi:MAG: NTP transferase domain-containing protein [bacterium]
MNPDPYISAIVLAAGCSSRMGNTDKLFLRINGTSILRMSVENVLNAHVDEVVVVTGESTLQVQQELKQLDAHVIENQNARYGMSASLVTGIASVNPKSEAALIVLADQPNLKPRSLNELIDAYLSSGKRISASRYQGILGTPALFDRTLYPELSNLEGDVGARSIINKFSGETTPVEIPEAESLDIDTLADFDKMKSLHVATKPEPEILNSDINKSG